MKNCYNLREIWLFDSKMLFMPVLLNIENFPAPEHKPCKTKFSLNVIFKTMSNYYQVPFISVASSEFASNLNVQVYNMKDIWIYIDKMNDKSLILLLNKLLTIEFIFPYLLLWFSCHTYK